MGPEREKLLGRLGLGTVLDALYYFPRRYEDRRPVKRIGELNFADKECVTGTVRTRGVVRTRGGQTLLRAAIGDGPNVLFASWFNQPYLSRVILPQSRIVLYGRAERQGRRIEMVHPEYELGGEENAVSLHSGRIVQIYPLTEELTQKGMRKLLHRVITDEAAGLKETLPYQMRKRLELPAIAWAVRQIHFPGEWDDYRRAYRRLVFDEFFRMQLAIRRRRRELSATDRSLAHDGGEEVARRVTGLLGFEFTEGQRRALDDTLADMKSGRRMNRLIQGDVGSGKTAVAAVALAFTAANGFQGALMAPTEVLAQQHYLYLSGLLEPLGIRCGYFGQGFSPDERRAMLLKLAEGWIQVAVGTHALIQPDVRFQKLGLAVCDEQHKFGVIQRGALAAKGAAHTLLMTATPIPRTLALTLYGELDISSVREMPKGRSPVRTFWMGQERRAEVYGWLEGELAGGRQAFVICPLINEKEGLKGAVATHRELESLFRHRKVDLLHGRLSASEKKKLMQRFKDGAFEILVSTVVVEVGVDVPNASFLIIENAERFGLAQLHQLRGRVGRGTAESVCVLFSDSASEETGERLRAFESTANGFEIAEADFGQRGAGDVLGMRQHGWVPLKIGDIVKDSGLMELAREEAARCVS